MKNILKVFMLISILFCSGCTSQKPMAQAPVYNITVTDNSQMVVGDNNIAESKAETKTEQIAKPDVRSEAKSSGSSWAMFWIGFISGIVIMIGIYFIYVRYFKRKD